ncbi:hypothetical protein LY78DRAFT_664593 [Colletotrichum sublineola]|nr:hypothetical protein LY78DRAFT_664593 [Colletotrichum sublineola]
MLGDVTIQSPFSFIPSFAFWPAAFFVGSFLFWFTQAFLRRGISHATSASDGFV